MSDILDNDIHTKYALHAQKTEIELTQLNEKVSEQSILFKEHIKDYREQNKKHLEILEKLNNKLDLSTQKLQSEIEKINQLDEIQNEQLKIHIEGVKTNKAALEFYKLEHDKRLDDLEKPREWFKMTKTAAIWVTAMAAGIGAVLKLFGVY